MIHWVQSVCVITMEYACQLLQTALVFKVACKYGRKLILLCFEFSGLKATFTLNSFVLRCVAHSLWFSKRFLLSNHEQRRTTTSNDEQRRTDAISKKLRYKKRVKMSEKMTARNATQDKKVEC